MIDLMLLFIYPFGFFRKVKWPPVLHTHKKLHTHKHRILNYYIYEKYVFTK